MIYWLLVIQTISEALMAAIRSTKIINSVGLGEFCKSRRQELGLTQEQVALGANVSRRFVYGLEHGKESLQFDKVCKVLTILSVNILLERR
jgi:DNA-binding XRE family transcriptional regulator